MRKGTKKIRRIFNGEKHYYVYDMDEDIEGKRRRIYGNSESEVRAKVSAEEKRRKKMLEMRAPTGEKMFSWCKYYVMSLVGDIPLTKIKRKLIITADTKELDEPSRIEESAMKTFLSGKKMTTAVKGYEELKEILIGALEKYRDYAKDKEQTDRLIEIVKKDDEGEERYTEVLETIIPADKFEDFVTYVAGSAIVTFGDNAKLILMTLYSGISVSEWSRASKGDIDLEKGTLRLKKGEALLTEKAMSYVMEVMKESEDGGLIFSNRSGRAVIASNAIVTLRKILERYGISQNVTSRNLQASVVNYWLMNGKDADYIKKHTGMTNRSFIKMAERIRLINALTQ